MTVTAKTFRKKPVEIQAMHWMGGAQDAAAVIDWILNAGGTARYVGVGEEHFMRRTPGDVAEFIVIDTLEGAHRNDIGDYTIRGVSNEHYPCKPDIFAKTYDAVEPSRIRPGSEQGA